MIYIDEARLLQIKKYLTDINYQLDIFQTLSQEVEDRLDDNYISRKNLDAREQQEHAVIMKFLYDLADSVESRRDNNFLRKYEIKENQ